jgi:hypothetical protein
MNSNYNVHNYGQFMARKIIPDSDSPKQKGQVKQMEKVNKKMKQVKQMEKVNKKKMKKIEEVNPTAKPKSVITEK